jgi:hypothetical protein
MVAPVTLSFSADANPLIKEIDRIRGELKALNTSSESFGAEYKKLMGEASLASKQYSASLKEISKGHQESTASLGEFLSKYREFIEIAGIAAAIEGIRALAERADELSYTAEGLGLATDRFQALADNAALTGVAMSKFARAMGEVDKFTVSGQKSLEELGIKLKGLSTDEAYFKLADAFSSMEDGAAKTALAIELFGKQGVQMLAILNQGGEALRQQAKDASELGTAMDKDAAEAAAKFADALDRLGGRVKDMTTVALYPLYTMLTDVTNVFTSAASAATAFANSLSKGFDFTGVKSASEAVGRMGDGFKEAGQAAGKAFSAQQEMLKGVEKSADKAKISGDEIAKAMNRGNASAGAASKSVKAATDEWEKYAKSIKDQQASIDGISRKQGILSGLLETGAISAQQFRISMKQLTDQQLAFDNALRGEDALGKFSESAKSAQRELDRIPEKLKELTRLLDAGSISQTIFDKMKGDLGGIDTPMEEVIKQLRETQAEMDRTAQKKAALDQIMAGGGSGFSSEAFDKVNESLKGTNEELTFAGVALGDFANQAASGLTDAFFAANQSFSTFFRNFMSQIAKMIVQALILKAINTAIGAFTGGSTGGAPAAASAGGTTRIIPPSSSGSSGISAFGPSDISTFSGGLVGTLAQPAIGARKSSGDVYINIQNQNSKDNKVEAKESTREDGSKVIDIMIKKKVMEALGDGSADRLFQRRWGLSPKPM